MLYTTPHARRLQEREEQQERIAAICRNMKSVSSSNKLGASRTVWNECLQKYVEVR